MFHAYSNVTAANVTGHLSNKTTVVTVVESRERQLRDSAVFQREIAYLGHIRDNLFKRNKCNLPVSRLQAIMNLKPMPLAVQLPIRKSDD